MRAATKSLFFWVPDRHSLMSVDKIEDLHDNKIVFRV